MNRPDYPPRQDPSDKEAVKDVDEDLKQVVRDQKEYKDYVEKFESLKTAKGLKEAGYSSQAEFVQTLKKAAAKWAPGAKRDAAELFAADFESRAQGGKGGDKERKKPTRGSDIASLAKQEAVEEVGGENDRKKKKRVSRSLAEQVKEIAGLQPTKKEVVLLSPEEGVEAEVVAPGAEAPSVETAGHVVEAIVKQQAEIGQPLTLAEYRQRLRDWFPRLAVRQGFRDAEGQQISNMDGNASLFFFRRILGFSQGTEAEKDYVTKDVVYTKPGEWQKGALNLDTSPHVHGGLAEDGSGFVDHHGPESPRGSSAFEILYNYFKEAGALDTLSAAERSSLEKVSQFVTCVDSYTLPQGLNWGDSWDESERTIFGITLTFQNEIGVEDLFEFFKTHDLKDAFTLAVDKSKEDYLAKFRKLSLGQYKNKKLTEKFVLEIEKSPSSVGFVAEFPGLGKILVQSQKSLQEKKPALQFAALARGYDGILVWEPGSQSFFLAVGQHKEITPAMLEKMGAGVLVRNSMVVKRKPGGEKTLAGLLAKLGVVKDSLPIGMRRQLEDVVEDKGVAVPAPATVEAVEAKPEIKAGVVETGGMEKAGDFKFFLFDTLVREHGVLPEILFKSAEDVRRLVENWDIFLESAKEYNLLAAHPSPAKAEAEKTIKLILSTHPDLAKEPVFSAWLEKIKVVSSSAKEEQPPMVLFKEGGLFRAGELVVPKGRQEADPKRVEGYVVIFGSRYYQLEGLADKRFPEENLERYIAPLAPPEPIIDLPSVFKEPLAPPPYEPLRPAASGSPDPGEAPLKLDLGVDLDFMREEQERRRREESGEASSSKVIDLWTEEEPESSVERDNLNWLKELSEGGENPETARIKMDETRRAYIELYKEFLGAKAGAAKWEKFKNKLPFLKKKDLTPTVLPEKVLEIKVKLEVARDVYLEAKKEYARALFQAKATELAASGKSPDEIAEELNAFGREIFNKLVIGEEASLQAAEAAEWPAREKNFLRKGFDWWFKQHWTVRALMTTGIFTGALFAGGYVGVGAVGGYTVSRLVRSLGGAWAGMVAGNLFDQMFGKQINKHLDNRLRETMEYALQAGYDPQASFDYLWRKQAALFKMKKFDDKFKFRLKIGVMIAAGLGASYGLNMVFSSTAEAAGQAAGIAVKEAAEHGGAGAGVRATAEAEVAARGGGVEETVGGGEGAEPSYEELQERLQRILEDSDRQNESFYESLRHNAEAGALQSKLDNLATIHKGEGVIHVFSRQLEALPVKFGYTGNLDDAAAIHEWAEKQATQLSIKGNYWNPTTGDQNWVRWNPKGAMRFYVEGDAQHGFKVTETGTEGRHFIHHPSVESAEAPRASVETPEVKTTSLSEAVAEKSSSPSLTSVAGTETLTTVSDFPKEVQPYANYLEVKIRSAQALVDQYAGDPKLGPAARSVLANVHDDIAKFVDDVDAKKLVTYEKFSSTEGAAAIKQSLVEAVEKQAGAKVPVAEIVPGKIPPMAELLKGGRIDIDKNWGLKFSTSPSGKIFPVIDASRAEFDKVFESHNNMKTDGWLKDDTTKDLLEGKNYFSSGEVQVNLSRMDFLVRALDKIKDTGAGGSEAATIVKGTVRRFMEGISETMKKTPEDIFNKTFLDRVR